MIVKIVRQELYSMLRRIAINLDLKSHTLYIRVMWKMSLFAYNLLSLTLINMEFCIKYAPGLVSIQMHILTCYMYLCRYFSIS